MQQDNIYHHHNMGPVKNLLCCHYHTILLVVLYFVVPGNTQQGTLCQEGWSYFRDLERGGLCVQASLEPKDWEASSRICKNQYAHLINLDRINQYTLIVRNQPPDGLGTYLFDKGLQDFWTGMHVKQGRLFWSDYGPKYVKRKYDLPWRWASGQPSTETGNCGRVNLGSKMEQRTNVTEGQEPFVYNVTVFNNQYEISLDNCDGLKQFVCQKPAIPDFVDTITHCEDGWVGNAYVPHCYRIFNSPGEFSTYDVAERRCISFGGELAPVKSTLEAKMASATNDYVLSSVEDYGSLEYEGMWVYSPPESKNDAGQCQALSAMFSDGVVPDPIYLACDTPAPFICRKMIVIEEPKKLLINTVYTRQRALLQYLAFSPLPVSFVMSRPPTASETLFIETPAGILNSTNNWSDARSEFDISISALSERPYVINITIPRINLAQRKRRDLYHIETEDNVRNSRVGSVINRVKRQISTIPNVEDIPRPLIAPSEAELVNTVGYYSFGIKSRFSPQFMSTSPVLVRYSELDLYVYILELTAKPEFVSDSAFITIEDANAFNLLDDFGQVSMLQEILGGVLNTLDFEPVGDISPNNIHSYRAILKHISHTDAKVKMQFRILLGITGSRVLPELEQLAMYLIEGYWKKRIENFDDITGVKIRSTVVCPLKGFSNGDDGRKATFPVTKIGKTAYSWERCYTEKGALAEAECQGNYDTGARWGPVTFRDVCKTTPDLEESESTASLKNLSTIVLNVDNYLTVINNTVQLTLPVINLTEADIIYTADILYNFQIFELADEKVINDVFDVVNNVLQVAQNVIFGAQKLDNSANRIIEALDDLAHKFNLARKRTARFSRNYVVAEIWQQTSSDDTLTVGISLGNNTDDVIDKDLIKSVNNGSEVDVNETDVAIYLPENVVRGDQSRLTFHIYGRPDLFSPVNARYKTNSKIAAARLSIGGEPVVDLGNDEVTSVFTPFETDGVLTCGYWDYSADEDGGGWNTTGCNATLEGGRVVCKCNHLTNFAVLIDLHAHKISETDKQILSIITTVGLIISIIGLGLTILGFVLFKHLRNGRGQQVLVNLSLAMLCSAIIFLVGMDKTSNKIGCVVVAALLHYFILVSFMWMLVEGVLQYLRFVKVLGTYIPRFLLKSAIPAWGLPLIPVIVILALDYNLYYGGKGYCWLSFNPMLYGFIIPVGVIILANAIVFIMVLCNLFRRKTKGMHVNQSERKMAFLHFKAALSIFVVLGLTWVFGFLAIEDARIVFHYIFAILNAFQGFFIFLLFTAREKLVRQAWMKLCCGRRYREKTSGAHSGSDTRTGRKGSNDTTSALTVSSGNGSKFDSLLDNKMKHKNGKNRL